MAVIGFAALMGKGLLAPLSMFNRMYRSIFTSRESKLNGGWLRAKVLWEERGQAGCTRQSVGSKWGARRTPCAEAGSLKR